MAYSTIPASDEPLVATKPQGKSIKALVVGAAVASFVIGALAATVVTSSAPLAPAALWMRRESTTSIWTSKRNYMVLPSWDFRAIRWIP